MALIAIHTFTVYTITIVFQYIAFTKGQQITPDDAVSIASPHMCP